MRATGSVVSAGAVRSLVPARVDRLPWTPFHREMILVTAGRCLLDQLGVEFDCCRRPHSAQYPDPPAVRRAFITNC
jgi:DNA-directed RNA polymerase subunit N (RpoN/RPB10)